MSSVRVALLLLVCTVLGAGAAQAAGVQSFRIEFPISWWKSDRKYAASGGATQCRARRRGMTLGEQRRLTSSDGATICTGDGSLDYDGLLSAITAAASSVGVTIPTPIYLIDVNLLNLFEKKDLNHTVEEFQYFVDNPTAGQFMFWSTLGTLASASLLNFVNTPAAYQQYYFSDATQSLPDQLNVRVDLLNAMVQRAGSNQSVVIYGHCDCGCDRTGEMFGSYAMRYLNYSWEQANAWNTKVAGRPMTCPTYFAMQWYCLYLVNQHGRTDLDCYKSQACSLLTEHAPAADSMLSRAEH